MKFRQTFLLLLASFILGSCTKDQPTPVTKEPEGFNFNSFDNNIIHGAIHDKMEQDYSDRKKLNYDIDLDEDGENDLSVVYFHHPDSIRNYVIALTALNQDLVLASKLVEETIFNCEWTFRGFDSISQQVVTQHFVTSACYEGNNDTCYTQTSEVAYPLVTNQDEVPSPDKIHWVDSVTLDKGYAFFFSDKVRETPDSVFYYSRSVRDYCFRLIRHFAMNIGFRKRVKGEWKYGWLNLTQSETMEGTFDIYINEYVIQE